MRSLIGIFGWLLAALGAVSLVLIGLCGSAGLVAGFDLTSAGAVVVAGLVAFGVFRVGQLLYRHGFGGTAPSGGGAAKGWRQWVGWGLIGLGVFQILPLLAQVIMLAGGDSDPTMLPYLGTSLVIGIALIVGGIALRRSGKAAQPLDRSQGDDAPSPPSSAA